MKDLQADRSGNKEVTLGKKRIACCKVTFLQELTGVYQANDLTRTDQTIPD